MHRKYRPRLETLASYSSGKHDKQTPTLHLPWVGEDTRYMSKTNTPPLVSQCFRKRKKNVAAASYTVATNTTNTADGLWSLRQLACHRRQQKPATDVLPTVTAASKGNLYPPPPPRSAPPRLHTTANPTLAHIINNNGQPSSSSTPAPPQANNKSKCLFSCACHVYIPVSISYLYNSTSIFFSLFLSLSFNLCLDL